MTLPLTPATYLGDPDRPSFVVGVEHVPDAPTAKPAINSAMLGPMVEFIANFWPMWDNEAGETLADVSEGNLATVHSPAPHIAWGAGKYGQAIVGAITVGTDNIPLATPIVLSGSYSLERLYRVGGVWTHEVVVNDELAQTNTIYVNGVPSAPTAFNATPLTIHDLAAWYNALPTAGDFGLEFARIWSRALFNYEAAALAVNPYLMFAMTQELLDEISAIVNFMKPMNSQWWFLFT